MNIKMKIDIKIVWPDGHYLNEKFEVRQFVKWFELIPCLNRVPFDGFRGNLFSDGICRLSSGSSPKNRKKQRRFSEKNRKKQKKTEEKVKKTEKMSQDYYELVINTSLNWGIDPPPPPIPLIQINGQSIRYFPHLTTTHTHTLHSYMHTD